MECRAGDRIGVPSRLGVIEDGFKFKEERTDEVGVEVGLVEDVRTRHRTDSFSFDFRDNQEKTGKTGQVDYRVYHMEKQERRSQAIGQFVVY